jgi:hypothetical protein
MDEPIQTLPPPDSATEIAEGYPDYRFFSRATRFFATLTLAGLFYLAWYLVFYILPGNHGIHPGQFLLITTLIFLLFSVLTGFVAYFLYKRRGGRVVKNELPPGVLEKRKHFGP